MRTIMITGSGAATASVAAATALAAAAAGRTTLLASFGPAQRLAALLHVPLAPTPQPIAERLDGCAYDALDALAVGWEQRRSKPGSPMPQTSTDELPPLPGIDLFLGLQQLRTQAQRYDLAVIDAGDYTTLLRTIAVPDGLRWLLRLLLGLDRGPGRSAQSQARALLPTALLPFELPGQAQDVRVAAEELRDTATFAGGSTLGFVLSPDPIALEEARLAIPALQLHGLAVAALIAGPLLPLDVQDDQLAALAARQRTVVEQARTTWTAQTLIQLPMTWPDTGLEALGNLGQTLYGVTSPEPMFAGAAPIELLPGPALAISLPGLPRGALRLTLSGDELIVRIGPYRRHMLLPEQLRGITAVKATRDGDRVLVQRRP